MHRNGFRRLAAFSTGLAAVFLSACTQTEHRVLYYPTGTAMESRSYLLEDGNAIPNGVHFTWYPDGGRKSMEIFRHGCPEGFWVEWHADGRIKSRAEYSDCDIRATIP